MHKDYYIDLFINKIKTDEFQNTIIDLENIIVNSNELLEGNYMYDHNTLNLSNFMQEKQINLFWAGSTAEKRILEIGFNAGHSTLLMLLGRDDSNLQFTIFDIGRHSYTKPAYEYLQNKFRNVEFEYIEGDSIITLPKWTENHTDLYNQYDVIHVDGGHDEECIINDMKNTVPLLKINGIMIIDDTYSGHINNCINYYVDNGILEDVDVLPTNYLKHRVVLKIK